MLNGRLGSLVATGLTSAGQNHRENLCSKPFCGKAQTPVVNKFRLPAQEAARAILPGVDEMPIS
jgi:hypothetical protein